MPQQFKRRLAFSVLTDKDHARLFDMITESILATAAAGLVAALLLMAELRITPEQRVELLGVTTYSGP